MISNYVVLSVPQWAIFAAISTLIYGWIEKKRIFGIVGSGILAALGLYAAFVLWAGMLVPESMFDIPDNLPKEELFNPGELPVEGRLLPFYWGLVANGVLALSVMILEIRKGKSPDRMKVILGLFAVLLFFSMTTVVRQ
jgi:hypothetical protein